jgi:hypothetical protein
VKKCEGIRDNVVKQIQTTEDAVQKGRLSDQLENLKRPPAAPELSSAHNYYGLAVDVRVLDSLEPVKTFLLLADSNQLSDHQL